MHEKMEYLIVFDVWHARLRECLNNYNQCGDSHFSSKEVRIVIMFSRSIHMGMHHSQMELSRTSDFLSQIIRLSCLTRMNDMNVGIRNSGIFSSVLPTFTPSLSSVCPCIPCFWDGLDFNVDVDVVKVESERGVLK